MWQDTLTVLRRCGGLSLNVLILGSVTAEQRDEVLDELRTAAGRDAGSIVVIDRLADLSTADQQALLRWLDEHRDAMVLSFATNAIFRLMTDGKFSERLFYRLNSITLSVDEETA
jgi:transcriptional regulator of acetoin/glycerol metabolism